MKIKINNYKNRKQNTTKQFNNYLIIKIKYKYKKKF